jgi:hypothetical protein
MPDTSIDQAAIQQTAIQIANYLANNLNSRLKEFRDMWYDNLLRRTKIEHKNPLNRFGDKIFSQNEEDGITLEIISRLGIQRGVFAEFGVDTGLEANTIVLAMLGWKGFWVSGDNLAFKVSEKSTTSNFIYQKEWITSENVISFLEFGKSAVRATKVNVISLDLDGNDYHIAEKILRSDANPDLFIIEYNPKFPPPFSFIMPYDENHRWTGGDFYGASIQSFIDLFGKFNYFLACSSGVTGSNAFFVHKSHKNLFRDVPEDLNLIWSPSRYHPLQMMFPVDPRTVELIIKKLNETSIL